MDEDERCCGTGTCLINSEGLCWCGQHWNGTAMCHPATTDAKPAIADAPKADEALRDGP